MRFEQLYPKRSPEELAARKAERDPIDAEFSDKWKHPQQITTALGETIDLYDMRPTHEKTPVPALMVHGFRGKAALWKANMREFYAHNRRSIVLDGSFGVEPDEHAVNLDERAGKAEQRNVAAILAALDGARVERADAVAHSRGCIDLVLAAYAYPERFRSIVLVEPAGMNPEETLLGMIRRNLREDLPSLAAAHDAFKRGEPGFEWERHPEDPLEVELEDVRKHPILAVKQLLSIAHTPIVDLLREVKAKGVGVLIVQSPEDKMFRGEVVYGMPRREGGEFARDEKGKIVMEKQGSIEAEKRSPEEPIANIVDGVISVRGIHVRWFDDPKPYTQLIDGQLTALAAKRGEL